MSELDPQAAQLLELGRLNPAPPLESMGIVAARAAVDASLPMLALPEEAVAHVALHRVQGPAGSIDVRRYRPVGSNARLPLPAVVFLHGGGWACCSVASHDSLCRYLCNRSGAEFVSVAYRLAPEHRFPAAIEDGLSVLDWLGRGSVDGIVEKQVDTPRCDQLLQAAAPEPGRPGAPAQHRRSTSSAWAPRNARFAPG